MDLSNIATRLAPTGSSLRFRQGTIVSVEAEQATLTVTIAGSTVPIFAVRYATGVMPVPGLAVWLATDGRDMFAIATLMDTATTPWGYYVDYTFCRSTTQPAAPTLPIPPSPPWYGSPPAGTIPLWMSEATKTPQGTLVGGWSLPVQLTGDPGPPGTPAPLLQIQYSVDGATSWHTIYTGTDVFIRTSSDAGVTWSSAVRIVGPPGAPGTPAPTLQIQYSVDGATSWHTPWVSGDLYIRTSSDGGSTWSTAVRIAGPQGAPGLAGAAAPQVQVQYSVNGSTLWHATWVAADAYMRTSTDGGAVWSVAAKIVGAQGVPGTSAPLLQVVYSVDGSTGWHATFAPATDVFMRTSADGGTVWSAAARIVGVQGNPGAAGSNGNWVDFWFAAKATAPATPFNNVTPPASAGTTWVNTPPTVPGGQYLYMTRAIKTYAGACFETIGTWSLPVQLTGSTGATGTFAADNVAAWKAAIVAAGGISLNETGDVGAVLHGTLAADHLGAGTVTAAVEMTTPIVRSGKALSTSTTAGFWLGLVGGIAKFLIGNATNFLSWDGTNLAIQGANITTSTGNAAELTPGIIESFNSGSDYGMRLVSPLADSATAATAQVEIGQRSDMGVVESSASSGGGSAYVTVYAVQGAQYGAGVVIIGGYSDDPAAGPAVNVSGGFSSDVALSPLVPKTLANLVNGWLGFDTPETTYSRAYYWKDACGWVHLEGMIKSGTLGAAAFVLPVGCRPYRELPFAVVANNAFGAVRVTPAGGVVPHTGSTAWFSLAGITFEASG